MSTLCLLLCNCWITPLADFRQNMPCQQRFSGFALAFQKEGTKLINDQGGVIAEWFGFGGWIRFETSKREEEVVERTAQTRIRPLVCPHALTGLFAKSLHDQSISNRPSRSSHRVARSGFLTLQSEIESVRPLCRAFARASFKSTGRRRDVAIYLESSMAVRHAFIKTYWSISFNMGLEKSSRPHSLVS